MNRLPQFFGLGLLGLALLVGVGASQDAKKDEKKEEKKGKGTLPPGFKDLGITAVQREKMGEIMSDYKSRISALEKQVKELRKQENQELFKILTDEQKEKYLKSKGLETKDKKDRSGDKKAPDLDKKIDTDKKELDKKAPDLDKKAPDLDKK